MSLSKYVPSPAPLRPGTIPEYILRELRRVSGVFQEYSEKFDTVDASLSVADANIAGKQNASGWPLDANGNYYVSLTYVVATRKVHVTALSGSTFDVYVRGTKHTIASPHVSVAHGTTAGGYFYFHDGSGFTWDTNPWPFDECPTCFVIQPTGLDGVGYFELHTWSRDPNIHRNLHYANGTQVRTRGAIAGYSLSADSDTGVTFGVGATTLLDEDIQYALDALTDGNGAGANYTIWYRTGVTGAWVYSRDNNFPFLQASGNIVYNDTTWSLNQASLNGQYVNYYLFAVPALDPEQELILIPGQAAYLTQAAAQAESYAGLSYGTLPFQEIAPMAQVTFERKNAYGATRGRAVIVAVTILAGSRASITAAVPAAQRVVAEFSASAGLRVVSASHTVMYELDAGGLTSKSASTTELYFLAFDASASAHYRVPGNAMPGGGGVPGGNRQLDEFSASAGLRVVSASHTIIYELNAPGLAAKSASTTELYFMAFDTSASAHVRVPGNAMPGPASSSRQIDEFSASAGLRVVSATHTVIYELNVGGLTPRSASTTELYYLAFDVSASSHIRVAGNALPGGGAASRNITEFSASAGLRVVSASHTVIYEMNVGGLTSRSASTSDLFFLAFDPSASAHFKVPASHMPAAPRSKYLDWFWDFHEFDADTGGVPPQWQSRTSAGTLTWFDNDIVVEVGRHPGFVRMQASNVGSFIYITYSPLGTGATSDWDLLRATDTETILAEFMFKFSHLPSAQAAKNLQYSVGLSSRTQQSTDSDFALLQIKETLNHVHVFQTGTSYTLTVSFTFSTSVWYHAAIAVTHRYARAWINNTQVAAASLSGTFSGGFTVQALTNVPVAGLPQAAYLDLDWVRLRQRWASPRWTELKPEWPQ